MNLVLREKARVTKSRAKKKNMDSAHGDDYDGVRTHFM